MWKLRIDDDQANRAMVNLVRDEYTIGRSEENTIRLTERTVSRRHAKLIRRNAAWFIAPLSESQKTMVDGEAVHKETALTHGVVIRIGDYRLELRDDAIKGTRSDPRAATQPAVPRGQFGAEPNRFVVLDGPTPGTQYPLFKRSLLIGRGEECDISLNDTSVSRVHAEINRTETGTYDIVDRGSSNGVRVNGNDVQKHHLEGGDMVELGDVVLRYLGAGDPSWPPEEDTGVSAVPKVAARPRFDLKSLVMYIVGGTLLGVAVILLLGKNEPMGSEPKPIASVASPAQIALDDALDLLRSDNVIGAHRKLGEIPTDSSLRQSADFVEIEQRWADLLFVAAEGEPDREVKRQIFDQIARAPGVDAERRKRAADQLAQLDETSESLDELPEVKDERPGPAPKASGALPQAGTEAPAAALPNLDETEPTAEDLPSPSLAPSPPAARRKTAPPQPRAPLPTTPVTANPYDE